MTKTLRCTSPITGAIFAEREILDRHTAADKVARARQAQPAWAARPLGERIRLVMAAIGHIGAMDSEIVPELAQMMGRPVRYGGEFSGFETRASYMASIAKDALKPIEIVLEDGVKRRIRREPLGVVLVIAPWNYPYLTAINTIAPALIAGNSVVLKHATQTMLVGERLATAFDRAGVPPEVFQNLYLDHETSAQLIAEGLFDFINFTGSVGGGRAIETAAAGTFTGIGLELGGKDPGYVMEDANLEAAVAGLVDGAMFNSGQCCCGIERIYVHAALYDDFVARAVDLVRQYRLGDPLDQTTSLGPMAHARFAADVRAQIAEAINDGATAHINTFAEDDGAAYLSPQVLTDVTHDMRIMQDETFGPVVAIMKVGDDEQAIALMNDSQFGLTCSLWTRDIDRGERIGARLATGTVLVNRADHVDPALCWTGCKNTGRGGALSMIGFHNLTRPKSYYLGKS